MIGAGSTHGKPGRRWRIILKPILRLVSWTCEPDWVTWR